MSDINLMSKFYEFLLSPVNFEVTFVFPIWHRSHFVEFVKLFYNPLYFIPLSAKTQFGF